MNNVSSCSNGSERRLKSLETRKSVPLRTDQIADIKGGEHIVSDVPKIATNDPRT